MLSPEVKESFLTIIRLGIGHSAWFQLKGTDWDAIEALAAQHGLSAILVDGVDRLPEAQRPPKIVLLQWIGEVLQNYEQRYEVYRRAIAEMAGWHNEHDFKMMILKGYACAMNWPKPEHRPCGDIDIWLFGKSQEADALLTKEKGIKVDKSHHHHTVFYWRDFMVENHYDFINVHHHKSNAEFEIILKELAQDDNHVIDLFGEKVYMPSPNLHALFLLKHSMAHFAAEGISIRQLLDWALFVKAHGNEVNWKWLEDVLEQYGMRKLYDIFNAICVEDLGFDVRLFTRIQFEPILKDKVLNEILSPKYSGGLPKGIINRSIYKYRRWRSNAWKHELCYKESMWSAFWSGLWNHILKPSSI